MSDALPLPPQPDLAHYRTLARNLQQACESGSPPNTAAAAQRFVARAHGFADWRTFAAHLEALAAAQSPVALFEAAADAIVTGESGTLRTLLEGHPELAHARSTREHRSTLLHYVSANGIEDFRQKTPQNIVAIAKLLIDAGADVNAESDAYGGRSTPLNLTATSCHPEAVGVQTALLQLLLDHGAAIELPGSAPTVNACLHNGRGTAALFLAGRGAHLDLEGAAGVGRLDLVQGFLDENGTPKPPATPQQLAYGFAWACEFGHYEVVEYLLDKSIKPDAKLPRGETGLHWAAFEGHGAIVRLLLDRGAPVDATEDSHGGTPLGWALYAWTTAKDPTRYYEVVARLRQRGARLDPQLESEDPNCQSAGAKIQADPRMQAALRGELPINSGTGL